MTDAPTVFVVDDDPGVRRSLQALMESAGLGVATYASAAEFLDALDVARPGCLLLDLRLKRGGSGLDLQDELRRRNVPLPIIVITAHGNVSSSVRALKGGAIDFLQKPIQPTVLIGRVREAIEQDRRARESARAASAIAERRARLTPREAEVLNLLVQGKASREIASSLDVSVRTVEGHRRMILLKMEVSSTAQLIRAVASLERDG